MTAYLLNIDKPLGISSHNVVAQVRRVAGIKRVGHAGTLDPLATGVLVIGVGKATRLLEYVVGQPKTYVTTVRLGQSTNTYDAEGEVTQERPVTVTETEMQGALKQFVGTIEQLPPIYSAIKVKGQPMYKLARKGIEVERKPRTVHIEYINWLGRNGNDVTLEIGCGTGTYIRSIGHDLGELLGCGGHLVMLKRTGVGPFLASTSTTLADLTSDTIDQHELAADIAVQHLPRLDLPAEQVRDLGFGRWVSADVEHALARVYGPDGAFAGLVTHTEGQWKPHKLFIPPLPPHNSVGQLPSTTEQL